MPHARYDSHLSCNDIVGDFGVRIGIEFPRKQALVIETVQFPKGLFHFVGGIGIDNFAVLFKKGIRLSAEDIEKSRSGIVSLSGELLRNADGNDVLCGDPVGMRCNLLRVIAKSARHVNQFLVRGGNFFAYDI